MYNLYHVFRFKNLVFVITFRRQNVGFCLKFDSALICWITNNIDICQCSYVICTVFFKSVYVLSEMFIFVKYKHVCLYSYVQKI